MKLKESREFEFNAVKLVQTLKEQNQELKRPRVPATSNGDKKTGPGLSIQECLQRHRQDNEFLDAGISESHVKDRRRVGLSKKPKLEYNHKRM